MKPLGLQSIPLADIDVSGRLRMVDPDHAALLAENMRQVGRLRQPVEVRERKGGGFKLIAGGHRYRAVEMLGWSEIEAFVFDASDDEARLAEIDENLVRHDLNPLDRAVFLAERKALYEKLHPQTKAGVAGGNTGPAGEGQALDWLTGQGATAQAQWEAAVRAAASAPRFAPSDEGQRIWNGLTEPQRLEVLARLGYTGPTGQGQAIDWVTATASGAQWEQLVLLAGAGQLGAANDVFRVPQFADGGQHAGGARIVGERGTELEITGQARYWSHQQTQDILSPKIVSVDMAPVVTAVGGVRSAIIDMGRMIADVASQVAANTDAIRQLQRDTALLHTKILKVATR